MYSPTADADMPDFQSVMACIFNQIMGVDITSNLHLETSIAK